MKEYESPISSLKYTERNKCFLPAETKVQWHMKKSVCQLGKMTKPSALLLFCLCGEQTQLPCLILNSLSCSLYKGKNVESIAQTCSHSQEANKSMEREFVPDVEPLFAEKEN